MTQSEYSRKANSTEYFSTNLLTVSSITCQLVSQALKKKSLSLLNCEECDTSLGLTFLDSLYENWCKFMIVSSTVHFWKANYSYSSKEQKISVRSPTMVSQQQHGSRSEQTYKQTNSVSTVPAATAAVARSEASQPPHNKGHVMSVSAHKALGADLKSSLTSMIRSWKINGSGQDSRVPF